MHSLDLKKVFFSLLVFLNAVTLLFAVKNIDIFYYNMSIIVITPAIYSICRQISQTSKMQGGALAVFFALISTFTSIYVTFVGDIRDTYIFAAIVFLWAIVISLMGLGLEKTDNVSKNQNLFNKTSCIIIICSSIPLLFSFVPDVSLHRLISNVFNMTTMALIAGTFINMVEIFLSKRTFNKQIKPVFFGLYSANMVMALIAFASYMTDMYQTNLIYTWYLFGVFCTLTAIMIYAFFLERKPRQIYQGFAVSKLASIYIIANFAFYVAVTGWRLIYANGKMPAIYYFIDSFGSGLVFLVQLYFFLNLGIPKLAKWVIIISGWPILLRNVIMWQLNVSYKSIDNMMIAFGWHNMLHLSSAFYAIAIITLLVVYVYCYLSYIFKQPGSKVVIA